MARQSYAYGTDERAIVPFTISKPAPTTAIIDVIDSPVNELLRLLGFSLTYTFDQGSQVTREVYLDLVDGSNNPIFAAEGAASLTDVNTVPGPPATVSMGAGGLGTQAGAGDGINFVIFELGIIDCFIPPGYKYRLHQIGFTAGDSVSEGFGFCELVDASLGAGSGGQRPPNANTLAMLLNTP